MGRRIFEAIAPRCFDGFERDLAILVLETHDGLVKAKGYNPDISPGDGEEMTGKPHPFSPLLLQRFLVVLL